MHRVGTPPLSSPSVYSDRVWLIFAPAEFVAQILVDAGAFGSSVTGWAAASGAGLGVVWLGLVMARRHARTCDTALQPWAVVATFLGLALARSLTVGVVAQVLGLTPSFDIIYRVLSVGFGAVLLATIAVVVAQHDAHRDVVDELEERRESLEILEETMDAQLARAASDLSAAVRETLAPALAALDEALASIRARPDVAAVVDDLQHLLEDEVRPMSHRIALEEPTQAPVRRPVAHGGFAPVPLPARIPLNMGFRPGLLAMGIVAAAAGTAARDLTPADAVAYLAVLGVYMWLVMDVARRLAGSRDVPTAAGVVLTFGYYLLVGATDLPLFNAVGLSTPRALQVPSLVTAVLAGTLLLALPLVQARRSATEAERTRVVERLAVSVAFVRRRRALARRRLAALLHGSLQGALHAAVWRLTDGPMPSQDDIETIRADIDAAFRRIGDVLPPGDHLHTDRTLDAITWTWRGRRHVVANVDPAARELLAADRDADEAVGEVVQEAVNNAFRHGRAKRVAVDLRWRQGAPGQGRARVEIAVWNDGAPWHDVERTGMGTALYDELCLTWDHTSDARGTTLRASVPVA